MGTHGYAKKAYGIVCECGKMTPRELSKVEGFQTRDTTGILRKMLFFGILDRRVGGIYFAKWPHLTYEEAMKTAGYGMEVS